MFETSARLRGELAEYSADAVEPVVGDDVVVVVVVDDGDAAAAAAAEAVDGRPCASRLLGRLGLRRTAPAPAAWLYIASDETPGALALRRRSMRVDAEDAAEDEGLNCGRVASGHKQRRTRVSSGNDSRASLSSTHRRRRARLRAYRPSTPTEESAGGSRDRLLLLDVEHGREKAQRKSSAFVARVRVRLSLLLRAVRFVAAVSRSR